MTADAKVGLLLGLVFIVIIAFLVNGLPNFFRGSAEASSAYETTIAELPTPNVILGNPRESLSDRQIGVPIPLRQVEQPNGEIRVPIPGRSPGEQIVEEPAVIREPIAQREAEAAREAAGMAKVAQPQAIRYVVRTRETLTGIAQQVYGPEVGGRKATLEMIARSNGLDSADVLQVGQVLTLPLTDTTNMPAQASRDTASDRLLRRHPEQLEAVTGHADRTRTVQPAARTPDYREHTVKRGESLSQISSQYLGTSRRVDEIVKLNSGIISSANDIKVGTVIKIPPK